MVPWLFVILMADDFSKNLSVKKYKAKKIKIWKREFPRIIWLLPSFACLCAKSFFFLNVCVDFNEIIPLIFGRYQFVCSNVHLFYKQKAFSDVWYHNEQYCFSLICSSRPDKQCLCNNSSIMQNDCDTACCIKKILI